MNKNSTSSESFHRFSLDYEVHKSSMKNAYMTPAGGEEPESAKVTCCSARRANPGITGFAKQQLKANIPRSEFCLHHWEAPGKKTC